MRRTGRVGVLGGTFDPIHCGHTAVAREAQRVFELERVTLIPSSQPPHRSQPPQVSGYHRFAMTALAASDWPSWRVSDAELNRPGPSYTFDTLTEIAHDGYHPSQIFFLLGSDAFAEIATWSRYPAVLELAHFVVVARTGTRLSSLAERVPDLSSRMITPAGFEESPNTRVILLEFATPDVSSTRVRACLRASQSIEGLVPVPVAAYIDAHDLYRAAPTDSSTVAGR